MLRKKAKKQVKVGAFEVAPGIRSITRYMFALVIVNVLGMGWYLIIRGNITAIEASLVASEIGIVTALKLVQKRQETKSGIQNTGDLTNEQEKKDS